MVISIRGVSFPASFFCTHNEGVWGTVPPNIAWSVASKGSTARSPLVWVVWGLVYHLIYLDPFR